MSTRARPGITEMLPQGIDTSRFVLEINVCRKQ